MGMWGSVRDDDDPSVSGDDAKWHSVALWQDVPPKPQPHGREQWGLGRWQLGSDSEMWPNNIFMCPQWVKISPDYNMMTNVLVAHSKRRDGQWRHAFPCQALGGWCG